MFKGLQVSMSQVLEALISEKIKELKLDDDLKKYKEPTRRVFKKKKEKKWQIQKKLRKYTSVLPVKVMAT